MTTTTQRRVAIATIALGLIIVVYLAVIAMSRLFGVAMAYADTGAAAAATGLTPTDIAAWAGALLAAAIVTLRIVAPMTKTKRDDAWLARLERLESVVHGGPAPTSGEISDKGPTPQ